MKCERVRDEIKAYIDGELGLIARLRVTCHLARCRQCREVEETTMDITRRLNQVEQNAAPAGLREKVMAGVGNRGQGTGNRRRLRPVFEIAGGLVVVVLVVAVVYPLFTTAKQSAHRSSELAQERLRSLPVAAKPATVDGDYDARVKGFPSPLSPVEDKTIARRADEGSAYNSLPKSKNESLGQLQSGLQIIRTADLTLQVKSFQKAYDRAVSICGSVGGYVTNSSAETEEKTPTSGTMVIRVPVGSFDRAVKRLSDLGVVKSRNVNGEDVTGEVVDLQSRLRNKRAEEQQYLDIMNRAKRVMDVVTVSNELYRVRGEIEEAEGRLKYLKSSAAMSTINLNMNEKEKVKPAPTSSIGGALKNAGASLVRTANGLAIILVWLGVYSPFWLLPIGIVIYMRKRTAAQS